MLLVRGGIRSDEGLKGRRGAPHRDWAATGVARRERCLDKLTDAPKVEPTTGDWAERPLAISLVPRTQRGGELRHDWARPQAVPGR